MTEYIEREALLKDIEYFLENFKKVALGVVSEQPATDVAEVRHGKWERKENSKVYWYACSVCNEEVPKNEYGDDYFSDYCPSCGAKMDLGDDEE